MQKQDCFYWKELYLKNGAKVTHFAPPWLIQGVEGVASQPPFQMKKK